MPWTDQSEPPDKSGPWDVAEGGDRETAAAGRRERRPRATPPSDGPASPWSATEPPPPAKPHRARRDTPGRPPKASTPPPRGPDLAKLGRRLRTQLRRTATTASGRSLKPQIVGAAVLGVLGAWAASGVYRVGPDQAGLVSRFGALVAVASPGLDYHLPAPIEGVRLVPVGAPERLEVAPPSEDGDGGVRMLSRDGEPLTLGFAVDWRVIDPVRYALHLLQPETTLRLAARSAVAEAVAGASAADLVSGQTDVGGRAAASLQRTLDRYGAGVAVARVEILGATPPQGAQAAFKDLAGAGDEVRAAAAEADAYRARALAAARGDAAKTVETARAEHDQEISVARGEAARFEAVDAAYRKAPGVTRDRLYTETMARVLHATPKVVFQASRTGAPQIVLPPDLFHPRPAPATAAPPAAPQPASDPDAAGQGGAGATQDARSTGPST